MCRYKDIGWQGYLKTICPEVWVLKEFSEALHVTFPAHVGQVWHHVSNDFETCILGQVETFTHCCNCMAPVGVTRDVLKDTLQTNL